MGPSLLLLAWLESSTVPRGLAALWTFGRVPMFFYVLHLYRDSFAGASSCQLCAASRCGWLLHGGIFGKPAGYGYDLPFVYLMWITVLLLLYLPCRWFAELKKRAERLVVVVPVTQKKPDPATFRARVSASFCMFEGSAFAGSAVAAAAIADGTVAAGVGFTANSGSTESLLPFELRGFPSPRAEFPRSPSGKRHRRSGLGA